MDSPEHLDIGGVSLCVLSEAEVVARVREEWRVIRGGVIVTANVDIVRAAARDRSLAELVADASLVVADGMPLVWAAWLMGKRLPGRVTGSSLVFSLSEAAAADGRSVFVLGGDPGIPQRAARVLQRRFPGLRVVGTAAPPRGFEETEQGMDEVVRAVVAAAPDLVMVGLGFPKQERMIQRLRESFPDAWYLGCGAAIPMAAGQFRRAPVVVQRFGMEWLHRLALEPRRLSRRYLWDDLPFAITLLSTALCKRFDRVRRVGPGASVLKPAEHALLRVRRRPIPKNPSYVCFCAQDWWCHNRAHSDFQLMRHIAEQRRVLVVNSIGMRMPMPGRSTHTARRIVRKLRSVAMFVRRPIPDLPDFYVMSPLPLPFYGVPWVRWLNAVIVRAQVHMVCLMLGLRAPIIFTTLPTAWDVVRPMLRRALVFNRSDRHSEFPEADRATIQTMERDLLASADHVLYVSRTLLAEEHTLTGERAHFLDHGVDVDHFRPREATELPADLTMIPEPRVGFFGALDGYLVDFDLLERVAVEMPDVSLVLIGDAAYPMDRFAKYSNVHWLGYRPYEQIPAYGSGFTVALMPWLDNQWIQYSNPIKLKEYLALGLPVVSTAFAEVTYYTDRVRVATSPADFVDAIRATLADGGLRTPEERRASVLDASWGARADRVIGLVEGGFQPAVTKAGSEF